MRGLSRAGCGEGRRGQRRAAVAPIRGGRQALFETLHSWRRFAARCKPVQARTSLRAIHDPLCSVARIGAWPMRDYSKVSPRFWNGVTAKTLRKLGPTTQVIAFYLFTGPHCNMLGLYYLALPTLCHETGSPLEGALKALRSLQCIDFAYYDHEAEMVFVPNMAREQLGKRLQPRDNRHVAVLRELEQLRNTPFFNDFVLRYREPYQLEMVELDKPLASPFEAPRKPLRSQEQEQDHDQEQDHEQEQEHEHAANGLHEQPAHTHGGVNGKVRQGEPQDSAEFRLLMHDYPRRSGSQRWTDARVHYAKNLHAGVNPLEMLAGVNRYAKYCLAEGLTGTALVQQAATFLGSNRGWCEDWTPTPAKLTASQQWLADQAAKDAAKVKAQEDGNAQH